MRETSTSPAAALSRADARFKVLALMFIAIFGLGMAVKFMPERTGDAVLSVALPTRNESSVFDGLREGDSVSLEKRTESAGEITAGEKESLGNADSPELRSALKSAASSIAARRFDEAIVTLNRVQPLATRSAPAYRLIGQALLGRGDAATARDFFSKSIDLDPTMAETYFSHASASESLGDLETALGGMRSFLHLVKNADPYRLQVAQARSAIWEWEAKLGRGVYGPTKGIPPGFTAEQIKRDGKGVGIMMQKPETLRPDGSMDYEIKAGKRFPELWKK